MDFFTGYDTPDTRGGVSKIEGEREGVNPNQADTMALIK